MHPVVELARNTVETFVRTGRKPPVPADLDDVLKARAGVFVSLKMHGDLRGCIGTFKPTKRSVAEETIDNAVAAVSEDPRFSPVRVEELPLLTISVDVLGVPEPVSDTSALDPKRYGVIVSKGRRKGLLLPDLEGVDTWQEQVTIACIKAGIDPADRDITIERFEVTRYR